MLMIGRLMLGKRSMGSRPRATKPRMAAASGAIRMAIELRRASSVIHMLLPRLRADSLAVADQLLSLDDDELVSAEPLGDLDERALPDAGGDRPLADDTVVDDEHDRSEEHTSELQSRSDLVCRLLLEKKKNTLDV